MMEARRGEVRAPRRRPSTGALPAPLVTLAALACLLRGAACDIVSYNFVVDVKSFNPTCTGARPSVVVNGRWPGPTIYANDGDEVRVRVFNNQSLPITIHWHGITMKGAQWYDGVPGVTQCGIAKGKAYTHIFRIMGQWGTFWWHSHVAQLRNTLHGALIIRPPSYNNEPLGVEIEGEHLLLGGDWFEESPSALMDSIAAAPFAGYPLPQALHINGRTLCAPQYFRVRRNKWYRLRVINTAMWGSFNLQIEKHNLVLHETEGGYLTHRTVKWIDVYPGMSYSLLLRADQEASTYWVILNPIYDVAKATSRALGVLQYVGQPRQPPGRRIPAGPTTVAEKASTGPRFQATITSPSIIQDLPRKVDKLIMTEINLHTLSSQQQLYSMNNVTLVAPSIPFLLADYQGKKVYSTTLQPDLPPKGLTAQKDGPFKAAPAVTVVPYNSWVQVVFQNHVPPGGMHPWHLHGFNFYVVAQGNGTFDPSKLYTYKYNLRNPPFRNVVAMFEGQWVAVRFKADNAGQWIMHCHLEQHGDQGLAMVIKVPFPKPKKGSRSGPRLLSAPPKDYPAC